jgi:hypothetical protein
MVIRRVCRWNELGAGDHNICEMRNPNGSSPRAPVDRPEIPGGGIATPSELCVEYTSQEDGPAEGGPTGQRGRNPNASHGGTRRWSPPIIHPLASVEKRAQVGRDPILAAQYRFGFFSYFLFYFWFHFKL